MSEIELNAVERGLVESALIFGRGASSFYWLGERAAGRTTAIMREDGTPVGKCLYDMTPERASYLLALIMVQVP